MATANISNRISLDGGPDVRAQVAAIVGEVNRLVAGVRDLADRFGSVDTGRLDQVRGQLQQTSAAAAQGSAQVQSFGGELLGFATKTAVAVGALVVAASGIVSSIARSAAETTAALQDTAAKFGLTVEVYQRLKSVADDAGVSVDGFNRILANVDRASTQAAGGIERIIPAGALATLTLQQIGPVADESLTRLAGGLGVARESISGSIDLIQRFGDTTVTVMNGVSRAALDGSKASESIKNGAKGAADALAQLGISAQVLASLTLEQKLQLIAIQLDKLPEGAAKAALASRLLGDEWRKNIEFFKQGTDAMKAGGDGLRAFSDSEIKTGKALKDALDELGAAFDFLKDKIGLLFAPAQTARAEWLTDLIDDARKLLDRFAEAEAAKRSLFSSVGDQFDPFRDFDLDKFRDFLNQSGRTGLAQAVELIRDISRDLATLWTNVLVPAGKLVMAAFDAVAEQINNAFGAEISGRLVAIVVAIGLLTGAFGALSAVFSPVVSLVGFVMTSFGSLGPLLLGAGIAVRAFWAEFRAAGSAAVSAVRAESAGFMAAFAQAARGNFAAAWALFKAAGLDALSSLRRALSELFGGQGSALFTNITRLISGVALAASGLAAIFNAIFGTNLNAEGLLLVAVLAQLTGALGVLSAIGRIASIALLPLGAAFLAAAAAAVILVRQFPDVAKSWQLVTQGFSNLLNGDLDAAVKAFGDAFAGVWTNLRQQGVLTWTILGAGAIAVGAAVVDLVGKVRTLAAVLLPLSPLLAALGSAAGIASDLTREIDPLQKEMEEITAAFSAGKISVDEYNKRMENLGNTLPGVASKNAATTTDFATRWKGAMAQIKEAIADTGTTSEETADKIVPPFRKAAQRIFSGFQEVAPGVWQKVEGDGRKAADGVANAFKGASGRVFNGFREVAPGVWRKIETDGAAAADRVASSFNKAAGRIFNGFQEVAPGVWRKLPEQAKQAADETTRVTDEQWKAINDTVTQSLDAQQRAFDAFNVGDKLTQDLAGVDQSFQTTEQTALSASQRIDQAFADLQAGGAAAAGGLTAASSQAGTFSDALSQVSTSFDGATIGGALDGVIEKLREGALVAQAMAHALASVNADGSTNAPFPGFAAGGPIVGPGTGTSDDIPIWASNGEYIEPAHVVRKPGVFTFLELLRRFGGDLGRVFESFGVMPRGFSLGGMVQGLSRQLAFEMPRFAAGGVVDFKPAPAAAPRAMHPVTIDLGGGRMLGGLFAPPDALSELQRQARIDQLRSSGRAPARGSRRG